MRAGLVWEAPRWGYLGDHLANIGYGLTAQQAGLTKTYTVEVPDNPITLPRSHPGFGPTSERRVRQNPEPCNYPPLGLTLFWLQTHLLGSGPYSVSPEQALEIAEDVCRLSPAQAAQLQTLKRDVHLAMEAPNADQTDIAAWSSPRLDRMLKDPQKQRLREATRFLGVQCNTLRSRVVMALAPLLAELVLVAATFAIVRRLSSRRSAIASAAVVWLLPPLAMDTFLWGQQDAWLLAGTSVLLLLLMRRRWLGAGVCLAVTALLKPQGMLLAPLVVAAACLMPGFSWRALAWRCVKSFAAAAGTACLLSLPWTLADGGEWFRQSYTENLKKYPLTTAMAFNVWYADALINDAPSSAVLDSSATVLGLTKDTWGKVLAALSLAGAAWLCRRRYRDRPELALVLFAALWLWSAFVWPARVHERYVLMCMPAAIAAATALPRLRLAVAVLAVVAAAELCWNIWLPTGAGKFSESRPRLCYQEAQRLEQLLPPERRSGVVYADFLRMEQAAYAEARRGKAPWEWCFVVLSLGSYAWFAAASAHDSRTGRLRESDHRATNVAVIR